MNFLLHTPTQRLPSRRISQTTKINTISVASRYIVFNYACTSAPVIPQFSNLNRVYSSGTTDEKRKGGSVPTLGFILQTQQFTFGALENNAALPMTVKFFPYFFVYLKKPFAANNNNAFQRFFSSKNFLTESFNTEL